MDRKSLAGLIAACGIGILFTGCNCGKQNTQQSFGGGRPDSSIGLTRGINKTPNSSLASSTGTAGSPYVSSSGMDSSHSFNSSNTIGGGTGSGYVNPSSSGSNAMGAAGGTALPPTSLSSGPMPGVGGSGSSLNPNSNWPSTSSNSSSSTNGSMSPLGAAAPTSRTSTSAQFGQAGTLSSRDSSNPRQADLRMTDSASPSVIPASGTTPIPPPPPTSDSSWNVTPSRSTAASRASSNSSASSASSSPPSIDNGDPALTAPAPSIGGSASPSSSGTGTSSTKGASTSMVPVPPWQQ
jgi:hypothetical protein